MFDRYFERRVRDTLAGAGIHVDGTRSFDMQVNDRRAFRHILLGRSLGLGEAYMDGWWDCHDLVQFFVRLFETYPGIRFGGVRGAILRAAMGVANLQSVPLARRVAERHYDLGNDFYEAMLGPTMAYTCAYWRGQTTLDGAQANKFWLICRKLGLGLGEETRILDLGCGWGGFAQFAAKHCGADVTAVNISKEQLAYARERSQGLPIDYVDSDWRYVDTLRDTRGPFDHAVSVGMLEHVGPRNFPAFFAAVKSVLKPGGIFLLHSIIGRGLVDPWMEKYIFPGGVAPSVEQVLSAARGHFAVEDVHNFAPDYARTLRAWRSNFARAWPRFERTGIYDARFYRMWEYYLSVCEAAFTARQRTQLYQFVLSTGRKPGTYRPIR